MTNKSPVLIEVKRNFIHKPSKTVLGDICVNGVAKHSSVENLDCLLPEGVYSLNWNKNNTPLTVRYQDKFNWFRQHLVFDNGADVYPDRGIYFHIANYSHDLKGCIGVGEYKSWDIRLNQPMVANSTKSFRMFYVFIDDLLEMSSPILVKITSVPDTPSML
ncbi:hypothetical protein BXY85_3744 [Roseivirga pacifica]|uniref:DUF5675 domain-containing protein n=1 Tax=Roseivirga pacifica TaxID=1267423 RepID=A0A1I0Q981_9BACT|nr:DUF5675 family protein [Roseivirga pacifica]RKQ43125.1 hypothetical protein BXY85_3744 [Roseivirga pacifica]SEW23577.1 hypothetical protein SAMN05216290_2131 [Roseivirga pacifica]